MLKHPPDTDLTAVEDRGELYGESYYQEWLPEHYGYLSLDQRAREDLPDRDLHWLSVLVKYRLPPGRALDIGAAHGGFVRLLDMAGFSSQGLELSPWLCDFAKSTFGVSMLSGPLEAQDLPKGSHAVVAMMDVVEHLQDPLGTLSDVATTLETDGVLLIQTPDFRPDLTYSDLVQSGDRFIEQFKPDEHLFLFNRSSIVEMLNEAGFPHVVFEEAVFSFYDMFLVASLTPLKPIAEDKVVQALTEDPNRRITLALLDAYASRRSLESTLRNLSADNDERLAVIIDQGQQLAEAHAFGQQMATELQHLNALSQTRAAQILNLNDALKQETTARKRIEGELNSAVEEKKRAEASLKEELQETSILAGQAQSLKSQKTALERLVHGVNGSRLYRAIRLLGRWRWFQDGLTQYSALPAFEPHTPVTPTRGRSIQAGALPSEIYRQSIDAFNQEQPNASLLEAIRKHNHAMLDLLHEWHPLENAMILDAGASPHGYALEHALDLGASLYAGIGLDIAPTARVQTESGQTGVLWKMDATSLRFPDDTFDCAISISTFEHILDIEGALMELHRVLRPGGTLFLNFEPLWTSASGHHLHHFGDWSNIVPPWGHLLWDSQRMEAELGPSWPGNASLTIHEALEWIYQSDAINRLSASDYRRAFAESPFTLEWLEAIPDETTSEADLQKAEGKLSIEAADLRIRGYMALLRKT